MSIPLEPKALYDFLSFWFVRVDEVHPSHFDFLTFDADVLKGFFDRTKDFVLSAPRSARWFVEQLCQKLALPSLPSSPDKWMDIESDMQAILFLSPEHLQARVVLPLGCVLMSERIHNALSGEDLRKFEKTLGSTLCKTLISFGGLTGGVHDKMPFSAMKHVKAETFLSEAHRIGLSYFLAACVLLKPPLALRVMLKLENKWMYVTEKKQPITFRADEAERVWSFITRAWKEVGLICFVS